MLGPVIWQSHKQNTVALSTTETEYMALASTAKEKIWLVNFLNELSFNNFVPDIPVIKCDNQSAIALAENPINHSRMKHIDIKYNCLREQVLDNNLKIEYIPTELMLADILTKVLNGSRIKKLLNLFEVKSST